MRLYDFIDKTTAQVYGIYGLLGGGKTLTAVELMLDFLNSGHTVCSNISLNIKNKSNFHLVDFSSCDWWSLPVGAPRGSDDPSRVAIFIDEAAEYFDQFSYSSYQVKSFMSWLRHSSKQGQFVFLIVQNPDFLVRSARSLCHSWINVVDMRQFRIPVLRFRLWFLSDYVYRRVFDKHGNLISRGLCFARKSRIGRFYDTSQIINNTSTARNYKPVPFSTRLYNYILARPFSLLLTPAIFLLLIILLL